MNNTKQILSGIIICMLILPFGCGKDDNPAGPQNNVPAELVGTWYYESGTLNGNPQELSFLLQWNPGTEYARFTVGSDRSFVYEELDVDSVVVWTESGTFTVNGNNATISVTENDDGPVNPPDVLSGTWSLNANQDELTLSTTFLNMPVVLVAVKYE